MIVKRLTDRNKLISFFILIFLSAIFLILLAEFSNPSHAAVDDVYSVSLLHFDGSDAATTFTDESDRSWTAYGDAQIDTAQAKFGSGSGLFDGTGDYISTADSPDWSFGSGNLTIDFWIKVDDLPAEGSYEMVYSQYQDVNNVFYVAIYRDQGLYYWSIQCLNASVPLFGSEITRQTTALGSGWHHIAVIKNGNSGNNWSIYQDGSQLGTAWSDSGVAFPDLAGPLYIGSYDGTQYSLNGWLDEFRVSKGIARWTDTFSPYADAYIPPAPVISSMSPGYVSTLGNTITQVIGSYFRAGPFGNTLDGVVQINNNINLNTDVATPSRSCPDAINYSVTALSSTSATLSETPAAGCLFAGDEILLINLQGIASAYGNVGRYETLTIASLSGNVVNFTAAKTNYYGDGVDDSNVGIQSTNQKVMLQRVPNYLNLTIASGVTVTASAWNGLKGGVMYFKVNGELINNGTISMIGKGYQGGISAPHSGYVDKRGGQGATIDADNTNRDASANLGGGGGGHPGQSGSYWWNGGGGGSYATTGADGTTGSGNGNAHGSGATYIYGSADLAQIFMGSGGGGSDDYGGNGGGIIMVNAAMITTLGTISASAQDISSSNYPGCGGGGSGGSVKLIAPAITLGTNQVTASGSSTYHYGNANCNGGVGGSGRIAVTYHDSLSGSTSPSLSSYLDHNLQMSTAEIDGQAVFASVVSDTKIVLLIPAHAAGLVAVKITNPDTQNITLSSGLEYVSPPTFTSVSPTQVPWAGGTAITITGTNFRSGDTVTINDTEATSVTFVNSTTLNAIVPSLIPGYKDITVNFAGNMGVTSHNALYYQESAPTISSLAPDTGSVTGATSVAIAGGNFLAGEYGTGLDGAINITANKNLNTDTIAAGRTCADAKNYSVLSVTNNTVILSDAPDSSCLAAGDEVLLISMQGSPWAYTNVGNFETFRIASIDNTLVTFTNSKSRYYGDITGNDKNIGTDATKQRVMMQRVPNYSNVTIANGYTLTANAWDGTRGGVVFFRVSETLTNSGSINMDNNGYTYGVGSSGGQGTQGESYTGPGSGLTTANGGAGGGGACGGCAAAQGGGASGATAGTAGYGTTGGGGGWYTAGAAGATYGDPTKLLLGSGGGGGSHTCNATPGRGGKGGGVIEIYAATVTNTGDISTKGENPATANGDSSGGGGSGGSLFVYSQVATLGSNLFDTGGGNYVPGGIGTLAVKYGTSYSGTTVTSSTISQYIPAILSVKFGEIAATAVTYSSPAALTAVTPVHDSDNVPVTVINPDGQQVSQPNGFFFDREATTPQDLYVNNVSAQTGESSPAADLLKTDLKFSAVFNAPQNDMVSSAYRLEVATDNTFISPFWDSGKVTFNDCAYLTRCPDIAYAGDTLTLGTTYYWRIRFWDNNDNQGNWSDAAVFTLVSGFVIRDQPAGITLVRTDNSGTDVTTVPLLGIITVGVESAQQQRIADVTVDFNNDWDWSSVQAGSLDNKAFFHVPGGITALPGYSNLNGDGYSLYVVKGTGSEILVCPGAASFNDINTGCPGRYLLNESSSQVTVVNLAGVNYWKIAGLTSTGAMSYLSGAVNDDINSLAVNTASDHTISFVTSYGLTDPSASLVLTFDPEGHAFDLSNIEITDIQLTDNADNIRSLASAADVNVWGVSINKSDDTITFNAPTSGSGYIPGATQILIRIGTNSGGTDQIINPAVPGSYLVRIALNDTIPEQSEVALPVVDSDQVDVNGSIGTSLIFDIDTGTADNVDCTPATCQSYEGGPAAGNYTIDLGELGSNRVNRSQDGQVQHNGVSGLINSVYLDLSTNALGGAGIYLKSNYGALAGPATDVINAVTNGNDITANSNTYGYTMMAVGVPAYGAVAFLQDCTTVNSFCGPTTSFIGILNTNSQPIQPGRVRLDFAAAPDYLDRPGNYTDTLTFIAVANF